MSPAWRTKLDYMVFRGPFQPTIFYYSNSYFPFAQFCPTYFFLESFSCLATKSFTMDDIKSFSIRVYAHILMKGYNHNTAIQVQIFPAYKLNLFSHIPEKCLNTCHRLLSVLLLISCYTLHRLHSKSQDCGLPFPR